MSESNGLLSRAAILAAEDLPHVDIAVPEWGGTVRVRSMTGTERDEWEASLMASNGPDATLNLKNLRARLVALTAIDATGARLFSSNGDVAKLGDKSAKALDRVYAGARKLSAVTREDVESLVKPSASDPSGDTISGSPSDSA